MTAPAAKRCDTDDSASVTDFWLTPEGDSAELVDDLVDFLGERVGIDGLLSGLGLDRLDRRPAPSRWSSAASRWSSLLRGVVSTSSTTLHAPPSRWSSLSRPPGPFRWSSLSRPPGPFRWSSLSRPQRPQSAYRVDAPAPAASYGFRWSRRDCLTPRWWPQGISTSADASATGRVSGRELVVVSWYAKRVRGRSLGVRLSIVDLTDRERPTYEHVMLVEPRVDAENGELRAGLVTIHAGGIAWFGSTVWVADTYGGFRLFDVADLTRVAGEGFEGYRYVLPQRSSYTAVTGLGAQRFRFSFVSLDRTGAVPALVTGEYDNTGASRRVARFELDPGTGGLALRAGVASPVALLTEGPARMQGLVSVQGRQFISTSNGRWRRGTLWTRPESESPRQRGSVLAVGPEDFAYWPQRDEVWNLSEHPPRRHVYAMPRAQFD